jgi:hypothetical protein
VAISVLTPIEGALSRTREVLFAPFDIKKWFTLGFCAFLATLGEGGGGNSSASWNDRGGRRRVEHGVDWVRDHWELVATIGALVALVLLAIVILVVWLKGRGRFMFLDGVVRNRGAVVEPWRNWRAEGNSAFWFMLVVGLIGLVALALSIGLGVTLAWSDIDAKVFGPDAWTGLVIGALLCFGIIVTMTLIDLFLNDFVVPAMYKRRIGVMEGWGVAWNEVITPYVGQVFLYVLMKILIAMVSVALVFGLICITFCVAACILVIPYIGTVLLLPLIVFDRSYSLCFLEQIGGEWELMSRSEA